MSATITYVGNEDTPEAITAYGVSFVRNQPVKVSDALAIRKLSGNSHFVVNARPAAMVEECLAIAKRAGDQFINPDGTYLVVESVSPMQLPPMPEPKRRNKSAKVSDGG